MKNEEIRDNFLGKKVKLVLKTGFIYVGIIEYVYAEAIKFRTEQKMSLIDLTKIEEIIEAM